MKGPTDRQLEVLRYLWDFHESQGYWPSLREIGARFAREGCQGSTFNACDHLRRLQRLGFLFVVPKTSRAMRITEEGLRVLGELPD